MTSNWESQPPSFFTSDSSLTRGKEYLVSSFHAGSVSSIKDYWVKQRKTEALPFPSHIQIYWWPSPWNLVLVLYKNDLLLKKNFHNEIKSTLLLNIVPITTKSGTNGMELRCITYEQRLHCHLHFLISTLFAHD